MTEFNKAIKHIKTCLFWDFADGQWLDTLYTPLDRDYFNRLMQGVVEAHEAENAKLRELCGEMLLYIAYPYVCVRPSVLVERARELGIEVDE